MIFEQLFKNHDVIVFFDTETTGLDPREDRIIEFAASIMQANLTLKKLDEFVKLPAGRSLPRNIVDLTGITDEILMRNGIDEHQLAIKLMVYINRYNRPLLVAHNAQFDIEFLQEFSKRNHNCIDFSKCDYLDTLSVFKDRVTYPHKLQNAINYYRLNDSVMNTHRAIDDVMALCAVARRMDQQRQDLHEYINLFGYNPKYGEPRHIDRVTYVPQPYSDFDKGITLPYKAAAFSLKEIVCS